MPTVVVHHKVGSFKTWLAGHKDRQEVFGPAISSFKTYQCMDDPNAVALVLEVTDMDKFGAIMSDPKVQPLKQKHTVIEPVEVYMPVDV